MPCKKKKKIALVALLGILVVAIPLAYAQTTREWVGHMVFRQNSPNVSFDGTLSFKNLAGTTVFTVGGSSNTAVSQMKMYFPTLSPVQMAAPTGPVVPLTSASQNFTVTGLTTKDTVFVNGPAATTFCPPIHYRVASDNTLAVIFAQLTGAACQPATGIYQIFAMRT